MIVPGVKVLARIRCQATRLRCAMDALVPMCNSAKATSPSARRCARSAARAAVTLEKSAGTSRPAREVARHPDSGEPIVANIGRFGPYVQHGKMYASLTRDDDVLEIGANRAIDLIRTKEQGGGGRGPAVGGRDVGEHPTGGKIVLRSGRYGPYVTGERSTPTFPRCEA